MNRDSLYFGRYARAAAIPVCLPRFPRLRRKRLNPPSPPRLGRRRLRAIVDQAEVESGEEVVGAGGVGMVGELGAPDLLLGAFLEIELGAEPGGTGQGAAWGFPAAHHE